MEIFYMGWKQLWRDFRKGLTQKEINGLTLTGIAATIFGIYIIPGGEPTKNFLLIVIPLLFVLGLNEYFSDNQSKRNGKNKRDKKTDHTLFIQALTAIILFATASIYLVTYFDDQELKEPHLSMSIDTNEKCPDGTYSSSGEKVGISIKNYGEYPTNVRFTNTTEGAISAFGYTSDEDYLVLGPQGTMSNSIYLNYVTDPNIQNYTISLFYSCSPIIRDCIWGPCPISCDFWTACGIKCIYEKNDGRWERKGDTIFLQWDRFNKICQNG